MARTSSATQARQTARARMHATIEAHRRRDQAATTRIAALEMALARRAAADRDAAHEVAGLIDLGYSPTETAQLAGQSPAEIRRLRKLAAQSGDLAPDAAGPAPGPDPGPGDVDQASERQLRLDDQSP